MMTRGMTNGKTATPQTGFLQLWPPLPRRVVFVQQLPTTKTMSERDLETSRSWLQMEWRRSRKVLRWAFSGLRTSTMKLAIRTKGHLPWLFTFDCTTFSIGLHILSQFHHLTDLNKNNLFSKPISWIYNLSCSIKFMFHTLITNMLIRWEF